MVSDKHKVANTSGYLRNSLKHTLPLVIPEVSLFVIESKPVI